MLDGESEVVKQVREEVKQVRRPSNWMPSEPVAAMISIWASVCHSRALGGDNILEVDECLAAYPNPYPMAQPAEFDRSDDLYEGTSGKYKKHSLDVESGSEPAYIAVDSALSRLGYPKVLIGLLLHLYPEAGRFGNSESQIDSDTPYRGFRPAWFIEPMFGRGQLGYYPQRAIDSILMQMHREFCHTLSERGQVASEPE